VADAVAAKAGTPQEAKGGTAHSVVRARLLLVDDEDLLREVLAEQLEEAGYRVVVAANGTEATRLLAAGEVVDVLVTDLSMPGMDGLAVIRAAHELNPALPAVLLTGYGGEATDIAPGTGTDFAMLRKPVRLADLVDRIQSLLAARKNANQRV
jgi:CheY-like chemotaxis protein